MILSKYANVKYPKNILTKYPINEYTSIHSNTCWFNNTHHLSSKLQVPKLIDTDKKVTKCRKIEVTFTPNQRNIMQQWFKLYKSVYNIAIHQANKNGLYNFIKLRALVKPMYKTLYEGEIKNCQIPIHTLDNAIRDVCKAYVSARGNLCAGNITHFNLRPKRKCNNKETIVIEGSSFSKVKNGFAIRVLDTVKTSESILGYKRDTRLTFDKRNNKYYMFIVIDTLKQIKLHCDTECALDPGLRTFQTSYDKKNYLDLGVNTMDQIKPILIKIDKVTKFKGKKWHKRYTRRLRLKISNMVDDLHWQTANFLTKRYNEITIGKLSTSIVSKKGNMSPMNKRLYYALSHFTFRQRLKHKCNERNVKYKEQCESYTTKKCGKCGKLNEVGIAKIFNCIYCKFSCGRDLNGARNIMIRKDLRL